MTTKHDTITRPARDKDAEAHSLNRQRIESNATDDDRAEELNYRRRERRRQQEKKEGFFSRLGSKLLGNTGDDEDEHSQHGWLNEDLPGYITPSYIEHNGLVMSLVELYISDGSNREMNYNNIIDLIPIDTHKNVNMYFMVTDTYIKGDTKKKLIQLNARSGKDVISDSEQNGPDEDRDNASIQKKNVADREDYDHYQLSLDSSVDPLVAYRITLAVIGHDHDTVDDQIKTLNILLAQRHPGAEWASLPGEQMDRYRDLFDRLEPDRFCNTSTGDNYAGLNFAVSAGLVDPNGLPVGKDVLQPTNATAFFDMNGTLQSQAFVCIPSNSHMDLYTRRAGGDNDDPEAPALTNQPSAGSIFTQYAANQAMLEGHRIHHMVLNDFNYFEKGLYYRKPNVKGIFERYDVSKVTINPMESWGDYENVVSTFDRRVQTLVNIFDVLNNLAISNESNGHKRAILLDAIRGFYTRQRLWTSDADEHPYRTTILNIEDHDAYPTIPVMLNEFKTMATDARKNNEGDKARDIEALQSTLEQSVSAYRGILGRPTRIREPKARQVYYDFSRIQSQQIRQVQLLNLIEYVIYTAKEGDIIALHGIDRLWTPVMKMMSESIKYAQKKGIRFIFESDVVANHTEQAIPLTDVFAMKGVFYTDLHKDVDWTVMGSCLSDEVPRYENALNMTLSTTIKNELMQKARCKILIHRGQGDVNTFVHANVYV